MGRSLHSGAEPQRVRVWDLPTRIFHWSLVACVAIALITGFLAPEWWMGVHIVAGYGLVFLLVFRLVWGIFGSEYARLLSMAHSMRYFGDYLRGLAMLRPPHYVGHNPVGAAMIYALLAVFIALVVTGLMVQAGEEKQGPLAGIATYATGVAAKELHEWLAFAAIAMIIVHIVGVLVESRLQNANLVRGMIDGWMRLPEGFHPPRQRPARPLAAALTLAVIAATAAAVLGLLARLPPHGVPDMPINATYRAECGDCHWAYHPSLLPRASWGGIMGGLGDHFGEDATLGTVEVTEIAAYLERFAALGIREARRDPQQRELHRLPSRRRQRPLRRSSHRHSAGSAPASGASGDGVADHPAQPLIVIAALDRGRSPGFRFSRRGTADGVGRAPSAPPRVAKWFDAQQRRRATRSSSSGEPAGLSGP